MKTPKTTCVKVNKNDAVTLAMAIKYARNHSSLFGSKDKRMLSKVQSQLDRFAK